jgi:hypothetical protein
VHIHNRVYRSHDYDLDSQCLAGDGGHMSAVDVVSLATAFLIALVIIITNVGPRD